MCGLADETNTVAPAMHAALSAYMASFIRNISAEMDSERDRLQRRYNAQKNADGLQAFTFFGTIIVCYASIVAFYYGLRFLDTRLDNCEQGAKPGSLSASCQSQSSCSVAAGAAQTETLAAQHAKASTGTAVANEVSAVPTKSVQEGNAQAPSNPTDPPPPCFSPA